MSETITFFCRRDVRRLGYHEAWPKKKAEPPQTVIKWLGSGGCIGTKKHKNRVTTKKYKCIDCGHEDHADSNAGFNIAVIPNGGIISAWSLLS